MASNKKTVFKNVSKKSKIRTKEYPLIKVSIISLVVEKIIINKINLSNHLLLINFIQNILNLFV